MDEEKINTKMTEYEICKEYREAKDPTQQIKILAQLNCCSNKDILAILEKNNEPIRKRAYTPKAKKTETVKDPTEAKEEIPAFVYAVLVDKLHAIDEVIAVKRGEVECLEGEHKRLRRWLKDQGLDV
ncbi:MAG: hypothetical protein IKH82_05575 [Clostridiales bacterium]|nr:hypothetical protein [Clostridiales bacterium]